MLLEMKLLDLLNHPIVVEVLNLVCEGQYTIDGSTFTLSQTLNSVLQYEAFSIKSMNQRIIENIKTMGQVNSKKQVGLQFYIWR